MPMPQPRRTGKNVLYTVITVLIVLVTIELGLTLMDLGGDEGIERDRKKSPGVACTRDRIGPPR